MKKYFLFQTENYGSSKINNDMPCDIYLHKQIPSTPQGDYICTVTTGFDAKKLIEILNGDNNGI